MFGARLLSLYSLAVLVQLSKTFQTFAGMLTITNGGLVSVPAMGI